MEMTFKMAFELPVIDLYLKRFNYNFRFYINTQKTSNILNESKVSFINKLTRRCRSQYGNHHRYLVNKNL